MKKVIPFVLSLIISIVIGFVLYDYCNIDDEELLITIVVSILFILNYIIKRYIVNYIFKTVRKKK